MKEEFKYYCGEKVIYEVSNYGRVKRNGKIFNCKLINSGYLSFSGHLLHRAVGELFLENKDNKPCIDHIDCNKLNNNVNNLKWVSYSENMMNPITRKNNSKAQTWQRGSGNPRYGVILSEDTKEKIRQKAIGRVGSNLGRKFSNEWINKIKESRKDTKYMNNGKKCKLVKPIDFQLFIDNGYSFVRLNKKKF